MVVGVAWRGYSCLVWLFLLPFESNGSFANVDCDETNVDIDPLDTSNDFDDPNNHYDRCPVHPSLLFGSWGIKLLCLLVLWSNWPPQKMWSYTRDALVDEKVLHGSKKPVKVTHSYVSKRDK